LNKKQPSFSEVYRIARKNGQIIKFPVKQNVIFEKIKKRLIGIHIGHAFKEPAIKPEKLLDAATI